MPTIPPPMIITMRPDRWPGSSSTSWPGALAPGGIDGSARPRAGRHEHHVRFELVDALRGDLLAEWMGRSRRAPRSGRSDAGDIDLVRCGQSHGIARRPSVCSQTRRSGPVRQRAPRLHAAGAGADDQPCGARLRQDRPTMRLEADRVSTRPHQRILHARHVAFSDSRSRQMLHEMGAHRHDRAGGAQWGSAISARPSE